MASILNKSKSKILTTDMNPFSPCSPQLILNCKDPGFNGFEDSDSEEALCICTRTVLETEEVAFFPLAGKLKCISNAP